MNSPGFLQTNPAWFSYGFPLVSSINPAFSEAVEDLPAAVGTAGCRALSLVPWLAWKIHL